VASRKKKKKKKFSATERLRAGKLTPEDFRALAYISGDQSFLDAAEAIEAANEFIEEAPGLLAEFRRQDQILAQNEENLSRRPSDSNRRSSLVDQHGEQGL